MSEHSKQVSHYPHMWLIIIPLLFAILTLSGVQFFSIFSPCLLWVVFFLPEAFYSVLLLDHCPRYQDLDTLLDFGDQKDQEYALYCRCFLDFPKGLKSSRKCCFGSVPFEQLSMLFIQKALTTFFIGPKTGKSNGWHRSVESGTNVMKQMFLSKQVLITSSLNVI